MGGLTEGRWAELEARPRLEAEKSSARLPTLRVSLRNPLTISYLSSERALLLLSSEVKPPGDECYVGNTPAQIDGERPEASFVSGLLVVSTSSISRSAVRNYCSRTSFGEPLQFHVVTPASHAEDLCFPGA